MGLTANDRYFASATPPYHGVWVGGLGAFAPRRMPGGACYSFTTPDGSVSPLTKCSAMDEIRRSRALMEEILARAASIKKTMADVKCRMNSMNDIEEGRVKKPDTEAELGTKLDDMQDEILTHICKHLNSFKSLVALSQELGIVEVDPTRVPRLDTTLMIGLSAKVDVGVQGLEDGGGRGGSSKGNVWLNIYRDRIEGQDIG
eukprot:gene2650-5028_t